MSHIIRVSGVYRVATKWNIRMHHYNYKRFIGITTYIHISITHRSGGNIGHGMSPL